MISREYGGPSKLSTAIRLSASSGAAQAFELVSYTPGQAVPFQPRAFVIKASVDIFVAAQGATSDTGGLDTSTSFEIDANVYWRIDVDRPEERFFVWRAVDTDGYVKVMCISKVV